MKLYVNHQLQDHRNTLQELKPHIHMHIVTFGNMDSYNTHQDLNLLKFATRIDQINDLLIKYRMEVTTWQKNK